ncbi:MAG: hypothetical protein J7M14_00970 [Planctomycetes bacterium]|nr:hypothetical protein [Planctomycetota bacterium]
MASLGLNWSPAGYATNGAAVGDVAVGDETRLPPTSVSTTHIVSVAAVNSIETAARAVVYEADAVAAWVNSQVDTQMVAPAPLSAGERPALEIPLTALDANLDNPLPGVLGA